VCLHACFLVCLYACLLDVYACQGFLVRTVRDQSWSQTEALGPNGPPLDRLGTSLGPMVKRPKKGPACMLVCLNA